MPRRAVRKKHVDESRYEPSVRLLEARRLLEQPEGQSVYDLAERLAVSDRTAWRILRALSAAGEPLVDSWDGARKVYRIAESGRAIRLRLTVAQAVALCLAQSTLGFLEGTGIKEDLDDVLASLEKSLARRDLFHTGGLARKIHARGEPAQELSGRIEDVDELVTALVREEKVVLHHEAVDAGKTPFLVRPYTLLVYKRGLYLAGFSEHHREIRTFGLDRMRSVERRAGDRFDYPKDFSPDGLFDGAFGLHRGDPVRVVVRFDAKVARFVRRRTWHPTQSLRELPDGGVELTMTSRGTTEITSWVLGFGETAEVVEPATLRDELGTVLRAAAARYAGPAKPVKAAKKRGRT